IGANVLVEVKDTTALKISFLIYLMPIILVLGAYLLMKTITSQSILIGIVTITAMFISILLLKKADKVIQPGYLITRYLQDDNCSQCPFKSKRTKDERLDRKE
ncbi:MAG: SoxR reducing system RseC family protein, partial [Candidatus Atribacteria bacterium]|nr:SoxR reducing system RseC family protein [Candidatus Atribacteria bacterium]